MTNSACPGLSSSAAARPRPWRRSRRPPTRTGRPGYHADRGRWPGRIGDRTSRACPAAGWRPGGSSSPSGACGPGWTWPRSRLGSAGTARRSSTSTPCCVSTPIREQARLLRSRSRSQRNDDQVLALYQRYVATMRELAPPVGPGAAAGDAAAGVTAPHFPAGNAPRTVAVRSNRRRHAHGGSDGRSDSFFPVPADPRTCGPRFRQAISRFTTGVAVITTARRTARPA